MGKLLAKSKLCSFLKKLAKKGELVIPIECDDGEIRYKAMDDFSRLNLTKQPTFMIKKYFMNSRENVFSFENKKIKGNNDLKKRVIFGCRLCDAASLTRLDRLFLNEYRDELYEQRRKEHCADSSALWRA